MTSRPSEQELLAVLTPSPMRRWFGILSIVFLGIILLWLASVPQPTPVWQLVFIAVGLWCFWSARNMHRATDDQILLTRDAILSASGDVIARVDNIARVDRGVFAFKPSNGFLVRLKTPEGPPVWRPGLWWRRGTFLGIGGVVPGGQSRAMAEILTAMTLGIFPGDED